MPLKCSICFHERRKEIDAALVAGTSLRTVADRFGSSKTSLIRHKMHASQSIVRASEKREERFGANLVDELLRINRKAWELLAKMEAEGDHRGSVVALREVTECVSTQDEILSRAMKVQAVTDPPSIEVRIIELGSEP